MANSPTFVRGAVSPLAGVQSCNEQQLAGGPVLGSRIPHPDECVICCLFRTRFCLDPGRPRTHTRPVCVTHLAPAFKKGGLTVWSQQTVCGARSLHAAAPVCGRPPTARRRGPSAILSGSNCRLGAGADFSSGVPRMRLNRLFLCSLERILTIHHHVQRASMHT